MERCRADEIISPIINDNSEDTSAVPTEEDPLLTEDDGFFPRAMGRSGSAGNFGVLDSPFIVPVLPQKKDEEMPLLHEPDEELLPGAVMQLRALMFVRCNWLQPIMISHIRSNGTPVSQIGMMLVVALIGRGLAQTFGQVAGDWLNMHQGLWVISVCGNMLVVLIISRLPFDFSVMCPCYIAFETCRGQGSPTMDALAVATLEVLGKREEYGQLRVFFSIGFSIMSLASGATCLKLWLHSQYLRCRFPCVSVLL